MRPDRTGRVEVFVKRQMETHRYLKKMLRHKAALLLCDESVDKTIWTHSPRTNVIEFREKHIFIHLD